MLCSDADLVGDGRGAGERRTGAERVAGQPGVTSRLLPLVAGLSQPPCGRWRSVEECDPARRSVTGSGSRKRRLVCFIRHRS